MKRGPIWPWIVAAVLALALTTAVSIAMGWAQSSWDQPRLAAAPANYPRMAVSYAVVGERTTAAICGNPCGCAIRDTVSQHCMIWLSYSCQSLAGVAMEEYRHCMGEEHYK